MYVIPGERPYNNTTWQGKKCPAWYSGGRAISLVVFIAFAIVFTIGVMLCCSYICIRRCRRLRFRGGAEPMTRAGAPPPPQGDNPQPYATQIYTPSTPQSYPPGATLQYNPGAPQPQPSGAPEPYPSGAWQPYNPGAYPVQHYAPTYWQPADQTEPSTPAIYNTEPPPPMNNSLRH